MAETDAERCLHLRIPDRRYRRVALLHELRRPRSVPFALRAGRWELAWEPPGADRLEYLLELEHRDGRVEQRPDPGNPRRVPGVFGAKSVVELPGYAPPAWLDAPERGTLRPLALPSRLLRAELDAKLWSPAGADPEEPLPLLVVHDGPQYAEHAALLRYLGTLPPLRAVLLPPPGDRGESYSASTRYARALAEEWLPELPPRTRTILMGASLGALAALHAHWFRATADALFLQSGSYFRRRLDAHEARFGRFARITRFVSTVVNGRADPPRIPVTIAVGLAEENLDNNRVVAEALRARGWDVELVERRDAHNWTAWRDTLHHLERLL